MAGGTHGAEREEREGAATKLTALLRAVRAVGETPVLGDVELPGVPLLEQRIAELLAAPAIASPYDFTRAAFGEDIVVMGAPNVEIVVHNRDRHILAKIRDLKRYDGAKTPFDPLGQGACLRLDDLERLLTRQP